MTLSAKLLACNKMKQAEKAWLTWRLLRDLGEKRDWISFASSLPEFLRCQSTWQRNAYEISFNDESVMGTDGSGENPKLMNMKTCGTQVFLSDWRKDRGLSPL